ncbi:nitrate- and nitrite sensing domain-containing protein [Streptomyces sp. NBC_00083]|uniref:sensor histidine kinase n=1 Tax=Streptomyces sp. NBC_00083 TaxID=2975647 RepID=UPI002253B674|nr:nitrate- and nitrite sensing domain-containing protein [Streptomyces sp. NBC_00083]MCX5385907.1 nitrate- and nitrite sensing domain-containing protein [Streptomyces sp. NBC_00083]
MQGRFKRDGSAAAEQEPQGGTGPKTAGSSPQHAQNPRGPENPSSSPAGEASGQTARTSGPSGASGGEQPNAERKPTGPVDTGSRIALRNWRISTRLVALLALPVVAATTLGGLRINQSMNDMQQLDHMQLLTDMTKQATELAAALQTERDDSAGPLSTGTSDARVQTDRSATDLVKKSFINATQDVSGTENDDALESIRRNVTNIAIQLQDLESIRKTAYKDGSTDSQTVESYSRLIRGLLSLSQDMAQATSNPEMIKRTRALAAFSSAKEYASVQRAIIAAALPATKDKSGNLLEPDRLYAKAAQDGERQALASFQNVYEANGGNATELMAPLDKGNAEITAANAYSQHVLKNTGGIAQEQRRSYLDWYDQDSNKINQMKTIEQTLLGEMEQKARELRDTSQRDAILNGVLILVVLGVSLVGAFVVARSMIRSLRRLQDTATRVAQDRLPELVKQLSESDPQDVDTSVESVGVHSRDEIGQVAAAFDDVHREAVRLAAEQALLRGNVNAMFTNLSRRSQGLIQRQLSLISELESREADPDQLSSLFKLDHLATRMRRNGENLLVLAGEEPGRRWTRPVPLVDVLRAAASEVEQYERIELAAVPATEVAGRVVNDLVHLLAELLENATSFSSPQTKVRVTGHALPDGRVLVEIHDTGIGLSPEDLAAINERLASPPTVDVSVSRRMGLFVVGRLSLRHGIRIQLRPSDSGGTTALVMLPVDVAQGGKKAPGKPGAGQPQAPAGQGGRPGLAGGPPSRAGLAAGPLGSGPAASGGRLGAGAPRGQVAGGQGPRAALPPRNGGPQQGQGPSQQGQQSAFGSGPAATPPAAPRRGDRPITPPPGAPRAELPGGGTGAPNQQQSRPQAASWGNDQSALDAPRGHEEPEQHTGQYPRPSFDERQGPAATAEFARPDFDGPPPGSQQDQSSGTGQFVRPDVFGAPTPQDPSATGQFERPGSYNGYGDQSSNTGQYARPGQDLSGTGSFERPGQDGANAGQYGRPDQDPSGTGQYPRPGQGGDTGQYGRPSGDDRQGPGATSEFGRPDFNAPRPPAPQPVQPQQYQQGPQQGQDFGQGGPRQRRDGNDLGGSGRTGSNLPAQARPEDGGAQRPDEARRPSDGWALPPAGAGDGRTPLYDTLETNWFQQQPGGQPQQPASQAPQAPQQQGRDAAPQSPLPERRPARETGSANGANGSGDAGSNGSGAWRSSPNDDLVRQAERARKPAAGGVTTSGLPKRVPRANLVPGTAQQQNHQAGPQVSRAPDDVRGRLTNLRRGIQQGRQANNGSTGSFHVDPTHQQER